jgi:hypothetical protein
MVFEDINTILYEIIRCVVPINNDTVPIHRNITFYHCQAYSLLDRSTSEAVKCTLFQTSFGQYKWILTGDQYALSHFPAFNLPKKNVGYFASTVRTFIKLLSHSFYSKVLVVVISWLPVTGLGLLCPVRVEQHKITCWISTVVLSLCIWLLATLVYCCIHDLLTTLWYYLYAFDC